MTTTRASLDILPRRAGAVLVTTLLALAASLAAAPSSQAASPCSHYGLAAGCHLQLGSSTGGGEGGGKGGKVIPLCNDGKPDYNAVACTNDFGVWSNARQCYLVLNTTVSRDDPVWQGKESGDVYDCVDRDGTIKTQVWLGTPPLPEGRNRGSVIGNILDMRFAAFYIGMAPSARPEKRNAGLVGLPVWMFAAGLRNRYTNYQYVEEPGQVARDDITGFFVQAWTKKTEWHMGDGTVVSCDRGTEYYPGMGLRESPDCGHVYKKPGFYRVTVKTIWQTRWRDADTAWPAVPYDEEQIVFERSAIVRIFENQVVGA